MTADDAKKTVTYYSVARVVSYTDAVFAIAATLLVLDLTTKTVGKVQSDAELWAALGGMWQTFLSFGISFALLSGLWVLHLRQFRDIARVDAVLLWINNARLLFVVLIPFTTSLVDEYSQFLAARILLPINFFLAVLLGVASWAWATARGGHLLKDDARSDAAQENAGGIAAVICGGLAVVLSPWLGSWAFTAYAFNGPLTALVRRLGRRGRAR
ncbi:TMEM175 family protein [Microbacterium sp. K24]|uniref:TMEM175 family protein n=1 Tax=Microbacterium sp. K24 TaxID=2305446 RepID=UPI00109CF552|nr:TMEM175 family protein [Microbacterium sp. K24]